jgi:hypothetical protein
MCSNVGRPGQARSEAEVSAQLAAAIDELAATVGADADAASADVADRLVRAWAIVTAADPELAARAARYSRS